MTTPKKKKTSTFVHLQTPIFNAAMTVLTIGNHQKRHISSNGPHTYGEPPVCSKSHWHSHFWSNKGFSVYVDSCLSTYLVDPIMTKSGL